VATLCFLTSRRSNHFANELLAGVAKAVADQGAAVTFAYERFPAFEEGTVYVVVPHEFFALAPEAGAPTPWHLDRTIGFCVEQPGTIWFEETCRYARSLGAVVDIRESVAGEMRMRGIPAEHFRLGYSQEWDHWGRDETSARPVDVLYLGSAEGRRDRVLASYAQTLWPRRARLLIPPEAPKTGPSANYLTGEAKYRQLRAAKCILNLHRTGADRLEWVRVLESICNGCVVVTEHSVDLAPLVAGEHLVSAGAESLAVLADHLLDDEPRLAAMRLAAYDFVRSELSMAPAAQRLIAMAEDVAGRPVSFRTRGDIPLPLPAPAAGRDPIRGAVEDELKPVRAALKRLALEAEQARRALEALRSPPGAGDPDGATPRVIAETPSYRAFQPRVSVGVSLHNYERAVVEALDSVAASDYGDYEIVVLDDASTDGSVAAVQELFERRPWIPSVLLAHPVNQGLGRTRNAITEHARGEFVFVLDADNAVLPNALTRLLDALGRAPSAMFAFGVLAGERGGEPAGLISAQPWDPARLPDDNYIDAMALIRRQRLIELGGYSEDQRLVGFEDYDLWCRLAEQGEYGVHVPEIVARYRLSADSMLSLTLIDTTVARSLMRAHAPRVLREGGASPETFPPPDVELLAEPAR
jgi:hypothetical protein